MVARLHVSFSLPQSRTFFPNNSKPGTLSTNLSQAGHWNTPQRICALTAMWTFWLQKAAFVDGVAEWEVLESISLDRRAMLTVARTAQSLKVDLLGCLGLRSIPRMVCDYAQSVRAIMGSAFPRTDPVILPSGLLWRARLLNTSVVSCFPRGSAIP